WRGSFRSSEIVNTTEVTGFFLKRRGRCFEGWMARTRRQNMSVSTPSIEVCLSRVTGSGRLQRRRFHG
ncbi:MAG: hypothetical protein ACREE6_02240, partial [Limisphaerales bacterium]